MQREAGYYWVRPRDGQPPTVAEWGEWNGHACWWFIAVLSPSIPEEDGEIEVLSGPLTPPGTPLLDDFKAKIASDPERYRKFIEGSWDCGPDPED